MLPLCSFHMPAPHDTLTITHLLHRNSTLTPIHRHSPSPPPSYPHPPWMTPPLLHALLPLPFSPHLTCTASHKARNTIISLHPELSSPRNPRSPPRADPPLPGALRAHGEKDELPRAVPPCLLASFLPPSRHPCLSASRPSLLPRSLPSLQPPALSPPLSLFSLPSAMAMAPLQSNLLQHERAKNTVSLSPSRPRTNAASTISLTAASASAADYPIFLFLPSRLAPA